MPPTPTDTGEAVNDDELVHLQTEAGVARITLDSPHNRNALSQQLVGDLERHVDTALADDEVRALLLTATGPVFCAGADLKEQATAEGVARSTDRLAGLLLRLLRSPKPVVTHLNGHTRAGGTGIVGASDIVLAPSSATFAFPEVHLGLVPAVIAVTTTRQMSRRAVSRYYLTGEVFDATEAARIGLITAAIDEAELDGVVEAVLDGLRRAAPSALASTKAFTQELEDLELEAAFERAAALSSERFRSEEGQEGIRSFLEKRSPRWAA
jgi:methylglutaconyl-CoA hydratase